MAPRRRWWLSSTRTGRLTSPRYDSIHPTNPLHPPARLARAEPGGEERFWAPHGRAGEWMKADIDDAPERVIRKPRKHGVFYTVICMAIGSIAMIGMLQATGRAPTLDSAYEKPSSTAGRIETSTRASDMPARQGLESSPLPASTDIHLPANTARQTVFNDQNFIPKGAVNVVAFQLGSDPPPRKQPSKGAQVTIVRQSPSMKDRACWPYRQGSIESRNCRASIGLKYRD